MKKSFNFRLGLSSAVLFLALALPKIAPAYVLSDHPPELKDCHETNTCPLSPQDDSEKYKPKKIPELVCIDPNVCGSAPQAQDPSVDSDGSDDQVADNSGTTVTQDSPVQAGTAPVNTHPVASLVSGGGCSLLAVPVSGGFDAGSLLLLAFFVGLPLLRRKK